ncbi:aldehyde dehydrogenase family protein [Sphingomonas changnyeongensis]|uniref:Aldehyde dehydrogenase family protein n=1 Tax=Sphingomonas changnyeongensis TaxID=2698679 RepID=A0A7Z2SA96_9SPHN|nr:NAD-dependent succinate-semialdehyde dehydrogenase [Sphingomonas changnyeongensis]QHL91619.1 aldehyde dehydrogenase family protein [Sphingomonas changnyeongensis]
MTYEAEAKLFVDGAWQGVEGREARPVMNPATGAVLGEVPLATPADLDRALAASARGFVRWRDTDPGERARVLRAAAALMRNRADAIATTLTREQGKPIGEARGEVEASAQLLDFYAGEATRIEGRVLMRPTGARSIVIRQPVGPVASFTPWNFPVYLMIKKLAPALAAGCSVIAKPPEETPGCTTAAMACLIDAGVPADVAQLVFGDPDMVSRHLLGSPVIRAISFTGSVPVGRHLMKLAADGLKRVTMELGGHAPVLVFDDCDLERTLDLVVPQKFRNAGQVCVSPTRFYVQAGIYDRFVAGFADRTRAIRIGDGLDPATAMGPLAHQRRPAAVGALVEDAVLRGAVLAAGGQRSGDGYFYQPTVLAGVPADAEVMRQEPFGPVALIRPFADEAEAIAEANRLPYGLASFLFTENGRRANRVADAIEAGMVGVNGFAISNADSPFGGVKDSGFGSEGGREGLDPFLFVKAIHQA